MSSHFVTAFLRRFDTLFLVACRTGRDRRSCICSVVGKPDPEGIECRRCVWSDLQRVLPAAYHLLVASPPCPNPSEGVSLSGKKAGGPGSTVRERSMTGGLALLHMFVRGSRRAWATLPCPITIHLGTTRALKAGKRDSLLF